MNSIVLVLLALFALMTQQYYVEDRFGNLHHMKSYKSWVKAGSNGMGALTGIANLVGAIRNRPQ